MKSNEYNELLLFLSLRCELPFPWDGSFVSWEKELNTAEVEEVIKPNCLTGEAA
jgi:hypothetical protein